MTIGLYTPWHIVHGVLAYGDQLLLALLRFRDTKQPLTGAWAIAAYLERTLVQKAKTFQNSRYTTLGGYFHAAHGLQMFLLRTKN